MLVGLDGSVVALTSAWIDDRHRIVPAGAGASVLLDRDGLHALAQVIAA